MNKEKKRKKGSFLWGVLPALLGGVLAVGICVCFLDRKGTGEEAGLPEAESRAQMLSEEESGDLPEPEMEETPERETVSSPEPSKEPVKTQEEILEEQAEEMLRGMTLEEKVLQTFLITPEALTDVPSVTVAGERTKSSILQYPVGGLIYFAHNLMSPEQVRKMLENTCAYYKEAGYPAPFLSVDEEGGRVARIGSQSAFGVEQFDDMSEIGKNGDTQEARRIGSVIGSYLSDLGFNLNFAPVADVLTNPQNQVVARRSFGSDARLVTDMALAEVQGMESEGVFATLKHYPGHGATLSDTHAGYACTEKTLEALEKEELVPFAEAVRAGVHFIMVAHIAAPLVTGDSTPSSLSRRMITDILRGKLGYDGIVVTDALNMGAISRQYSSAQAAVAALKAGADMVLMPEDFRSAYQGALDAAKSGELSEEELDAAVRRILRVKCMMGQNAPKIDFRVSGKFGLAN